MTSATTYEVSYSQRVDEEDPESERREVFYVTSARPERRNVFLDPKPTHIYPTGLTIREVKKDEQNGC